MEVCEFKDRIWDYSRKIYEVTNGICSPICQEHGLTMLQLRALFALYRRDHTVGSLATEIFVADANVSAMCKKLAQRGLLHRYRQPDDERVVKLTLSQGGMEIVRAMDSALNAKVKIALDHENLDDIILGMEKLYILLQRIYAD